MNVSFLNPDPNVAHDAIGKTLLRQILAQEAEVYANPQLEFAEGEAKSSKDKLTTAQNALADFKSGHKNADLQQQVTQLLRARTDVESRSEI